jgi:hypothetical protein
MADFHTLLLGSKSRSWEASSISTMARNIAILSCLVFTLGCAGSGCVDGCRDMCGPLYRSSCVDDYTTGYADGLQGEYTFGVVSDARAAGYADGRTDGTAARPTPPNR